MKTTRITNSTLLLLLLVHSSCATRTTLFTGQKPPTTGYNILWKKEGHQYTTFLVAMLAGIDPSKADVLTYYSQAPDLDCRFNAVPVAVWATFVPWRWQWRSDIEQTLHSLHGGNNAEVQFRRKYVADLVRERVRNGSPESLIAAGLMIHALGDAHSHTMGEYGSDSEEAYGPLVGHGLRGGHPDEIARPEVFPKYAAYVRRLYSALDGPPEGQRKVEAYLDMLSTNRWNSKVEKFATADERMSRVIWNWSTNAPGFSRERYESFVKSAGRLDKSVVQRVMDDINRGVSTSRGAQPNSK